MVNSQAPIPSISLPSSFHGRNVTPPFLKGKDGFQDDYSGHELVRLAADLLTKVGIDSAELDARILLEHVFKLPATHSYFAHDRIARDDEERVFFALLRRRLTHEPMAYLLGQKEFYGHNFLVSPACLIPRPDTECVVEQCLSRLKGNERVVDVCTGSGAIALTLLKERPGISVIATDISPKALMIAKNNAALLGVLERVSFRQGDLLSVLASHEQFDMIVANPPYINPADYAQLSRTVRDFEPELALNAHDEYGISFYERLLQQAPKHLGEKGCLVMEIGYQQAEMVKSLVGDEWASVELFYDLANNPRVLLMTRS